MKRPEPMKLKRLLFLVLGLAMALPGLAQDSEKQVYLLSFTPESFEFIKKSDNQIPPRELWFDLKVSKELSPDSAIALIYTPGVDQTQVKYEKECPKQDRKNYYESACRIFSIEGSLLKLSPHFIKYYVESYNKESRAYRLYNNSLYGNTLVSLTEANEETYNSIGDFIEKIFDLPIQAYHDGSKLGVKQTYRIKFKRDLKRNEYSRLTSQIIQWQANAYDKTFNMPDPEYAELLAITEENARFIRENYHTKTEIQSDQKVHRDINQCYREDTPIAYVYTGVKIPSNQITHSIRGDHRGLFYIEDGILKLKKQPAKCSAAPAKDYRINIVSTGRNGRSSFSPFSFDFIKNTYEENKGRISLIELAYLFHEQNTTLSIEKALALTKDYLKPNASKAKGKLEPLTKDDISKLPNHAMMGNFMHEFFMKEKDPFYLFTGGEVSLAFLSDHDDDDTDWGLTSYFNYTYEGQKHLYMIPHLFRMDLRDNGIRFGAAVNESLIIRVSGDANYREFSETIFVHHDEKENEEGHLKFWDRVMPSSAELISVGWKQLRQSDDSDVKMSIRTLKNVGIGIGVSWRPRAIIKRKEVTTLAPLSDNAPKLRYQDPADTLFETD